MVGTCFFGSGCWEEAVCYGENVLGVTLQLLLLAGNYAVGLFGLRWRSYSDGGLRFA